MMQNKFTTWNEISENLNKLEEVPSDNVWLRIQQKKIRRRLVRLSYSSVAASILLVFGVFLLNREKSISFSGYYYEPVLEKTEAESFYASITFSNTKLPHNGKVLEGNDLKMLVPKKP
jgi:hypothetical protein